MIYLSIPEYGRIKRSNISERLLRRLQRFDDSFSRAGSGNVFDWSHTHYVRALNYVGVVQIPGLVIEILPKTDSSPDQDVEPYAPRDSRKTLSQRNLLYMLSLTRRVPIRERDLASLYLQKLPLLETLVLIFAERLWSELRKGLTRAYVYREENAAFIKGKLLICEHIRRNSVDCGKVYVGYDEFISDTWLNRILKAACRKLINIVRLARTQRRLRKAFLFFSEVTDCQIESYHFDKISLNRNTERFSSLLDFCRIVLTQSAPTPSLGGTNTFSMLFPMEVLFEEFIARFIRHYADDLGLSRHAVRIQASKRRKWLLRAPDGAGKFRLRPDIVIDGPESTAAMIIDTKWKRLLSDKEDAKNGVSQADLYQLYAYATRYESPDSILLYPKVQGVSPKIYYLEGDTSKRIRTEHVDLGRDLFKEKESFKGDLRRVLTV